MDKVSHTRRRAVGRCRLLFGAAALLFWVVGSFSGTVLAAPLDEFLTAQRGYPPMHGEFEVSLDMMNGTIDFADIRGGNATYAGTNVGDYKGAHISGGIALTHRLWIDGSLWNRVLQTPQESMDIFSWHAGIQYQMTVNLGYLPALAVRFSGWGNSAKDARKGTSSSLGNVPVNEVDVKSPDDKQMQLDLIGTWNISEKDTVSLFVGGGTSDVNFKELFASMGKGCQYRVGSPSRYELTGELVSGDPGECQVLSFDLNSPTPKYPGPDMFRIRYQASYYHIGGMYQWFNDAWRVRLGTRYERISRDGVDDDLRDAGLPSFDSSLTATGEVGYKVYKSYALFLRAQVMNHQLLGEIPFSYNRFTSSKFDQQYGLVNFGIQGGF
ncbi:MAG: hypothetical protein HQL66_01155 [Magnetococcales bacterium]|nr:hypothetical protein [Magnetococcales bacterium]